MILTKNLAGVCRIASTKRTNLQGVSFEDGVATATDGYMMIQAPFVEPEDEKIFNGEYPNFKMKGVYDAKELLKVIKSLPKGDRFSRSWTSKNRKNETCFVSRNKKSFNVVSIQEESEQFPDFKSLLKDLSKEKARVKINVDPKLLIKLLEAIVESVGYVPSHGVEIIISDKLSPVQLKVQGILGIIMPIRKGDDL